MIIGAIKQPLTAETILSKVSEYDIFRLLLGRDFKVNKPFCNTMRGEDHESGIIRSVRGRLKMKDYGDSRFNGDCFDIWGIARGKNNYDDILNDINNIFGLENPKEISIINWKQPKIEEIKMPYFQIEPRKPTQEELRYWGEHLISDASLKQDNIYFPSTIYRNGKRLPHSPLLTFAYYYPDLDAFKLYRPYGRIKKRSDEFIPYQYRKWDSGIPNDYFERLTLIEGCDDILIATSKKDRLAVAGVTGLQNIGNVQSENEAAFSKEDMERIKAGTMRQWIMADSDEPGLKFGRLMNEKYGFNVIHPPTNLQGIKDYAEWIKKGGKDEVIRQLSELGLLV